jgi:AcrR family transcriptional regulator
MADGAPTAEAPVRRRAQAARTSGAVLRGRRRDASRDDALRQATIDLLVEHGYDRLTIDAVAARARAGKATVYRRWASKADLVVDAVTRGYPGVDIPDTGSVRGDLGALVCGIDDGGDQGFKTRLFSGLVPALLESPELRDAFQKAIGVQPVLDVILERGVQRGEICAPKNPDLIGALFPALAFYRMIMFGESPDIEFATTVLDDIILPLLLGSQG